MTRIQYTGEFECSTVRPMADWKPGESKDLDPDDAAVLLSNALFRSENAPIQIDDTIPVTPQEMNSDA